MSQRHYKKRQCAEHDFLPTSWRIFTAVKIFFYCATEKFSLGVKIYLPATFEVNDTSSVELSTITESFITFVVIFGVAFVILILDVLTSLFKWLLSPSAKTYIVLVPTSVKP